MGQLTGKVALVTGAAVGMGRAIAVAYAREGAKVAVNFSKSKKEAEETAAQVKQAGGDSLLVQADVSKDAEVEMAFQEVEQKWGSLDFLVHSIAYAGRDELRQPFHQTSREGFRVALDISAYSLIAVTKAALPLMKNGGSVLTMTYLGSLRAMPNYNVMGVAKAALEATVRYLAAELGEKGVRVNAISAGPIRTLAATGISNFSEIFGIMENRSPMHRSVTQEEVGKSALYLLSDLASGVTGEVHFVDTGYNIVGL